MLAQIKNNKTGIVFMMRLVKEGDKYGRDMQLTHDTPDTLVEFYDTRSAFDTDPNGVVLGQFVTRYFAKSIMSISGEEYGGLPLDGGIPDWSLDQSALTSAIVLLKNWTR